MSANEQFCHRIQLPVVHYGQFTLLSRQGKSKLLLVQSNESL